MFGAFPFRGSAAVAAGRITGAGLRGRAWLRMFPDIYLHASITPTHRLWCEAALLYVACREAALACRSAAYMMGVDLLVPEELPVTVTVPPSVRPGIVRASSDRLVAIRSTLASGDVLDTRLPVTAPLRTAFDLARLSPFREAVIAVDAMAGRGLITRDDLRDYALGAPRCHGVRRIGPVIAAMEPLSGSPMETVLRLAVVAAGLPRPEAQVEVYAADGTFLGRVDLAYRERRVALEYEGDHHRDVATFRRDIRRYNAMQEAGWIVIRVTAGDIHRPEAFLRQLRAALGL
jgi:hypothetical protein